MIFLGFFLIDIVIKILLQGKIYMTKTLAKTDLLILILDLGLTIWALIDKL